MHTLPKIICTGVAITGLLVTGGCAASPPPTAAPTGSLEGIVTDASTSAPVPEVQVTIAGQAGVFTVAADTDGRYEVAGLPAGAYLVSAQATGYFVNVAQVGVVANVVSSGDMALEPAVVAVVTATPTSVPAPTDTPTPTPIMPPTDTPTPTVAATPSPTQTPIPARQASTAAQSRSTHAAPVLLEPGDGSVFTGPRRITFRWAGSCCLAADEYYVVSIPHPQGVEEAWVKTTAWVSPDYLYLLVPKSRQLTWNVSVRRHTGEYPNGQWKGPIVSPVSETWHLVWRASGAGGGAQVSPLATPQP